MNPTYKPMMNICFSVLILVFSILVLKEFFIPIIWAGIITIATWPLYTKGLKLLGFHRACAAAFSTVLVTCLTALPFFWVTRILTSEIQTLSKFLIDAHAYGASFPDWLNQFPGNFSTYLRAFWAQTLGKPHGLIEWLKNSLYLFSSLTPLFKTVWEELIHRGLSFGFAMLTLFFFYKDGFSLKASIESVGHFCLGKRFTRYINVIPSAISATVNGVVFLGIIIGIIMGLVYAYVGLPAPVLLGCITTLLVMIPFAVTLVFALAAFILIIQDQLLSALMVTLFGAGLVFIVDHFIKPAIIGGATQLHFLAVLFGILGGVKAFGIMGLFLGPVAMAFLTILWNEALEKP